MPTKIAAFSLSLFSLLAALGFWCVGLEPLEFTLLAPTWPRAPAETLAFYIEERPILTRTRHVTHYALWTRYTFKAQGQLISSAQDHLLRVFLQQKEAQNHQRHLAQGLTIRFNPNHPQQNLPQVEIGYWAQRQVEFFAMGLIFFIGSLTLLSAHSGSTNFRAMKNCLSSLTPNRRQAVVLFFLLTLGAFLRQRWEMLGLTVAYLAMAWTPRQRFWPAHLAGLLCLGLYLALGLQGVW